MTSRFASRIGRLFRMSLLNGDSRTQPYDRLIPRSILKKRRSKCDVYGWQIGSPLYTDRQIFPWTLKYVEDNGVRPWKAASKLALNVPPCCSWC